jgi:hypothetical protein
VKVDELLERLDGVQQRGSGWVARCPSHEDSNPSLSIHETEDDNFVLKCHANAGCTFETIMKAIGGGDGKQDEPVATYDYTDEHGALLYQVLRFEKEDGKKTFKQRQPDGDGGWIWNMQGARRVPYRLAELLAAIEAGKWIVIVEGEKDADAGNTHAGGGFFFTCSVGGAGGWKKDYGRYFKGAKVTIWPDKDEPGHSYARAVRSSLEGHALSVAVVEAAQGKDAHDHFVVHKLTVDQVVPIAIRDRPDVVSLSEIEVKNAEWHLKHFVQVGAFHLLIGEGGVGKGVWLSRLASRITLGQTECPTAPRNVLVVASEDSPDVDLKPRVLAAGGDASRVFVVKRHIFLPRDTDYLEKLIEQKQIGLLIIDPVANHIGGSSDEEVSVRLAINELNFVAGRTDCTIIGVRHTPKSDPSSALGSVAWTNSPRFVLLFQKYGEGSRRSLSVRKSNRGTTGATQSYHLVGTTVPGVASSVPLVVTDSEYLELLPAPETEVIRDDPWFAQPDA